MRYILFCILSCIAFLPGMARADCSSPAATAGKVIYDGDHSMMSYCDGTNWIAMGRKADCQNIGDVCPDGTIYAGLSPDGEERMFTTATDQSRGGAYWGTRVFVTGETSVITGQSNTAGIYEHVVNGDGEDNPDDGYTPNAAVLCEELAAHGHNDWYLPAENELIRLADNRVAVGGFDLTGTVPGGYYWSSTENNSTAARAIRLSTSVPSNVAKQSPRSVRCVRKNAPDTSLVGHWKLNETSGGSIADSSGNGNTGTWTDGDNDDVTEETSPGKVETALNFDGLNDYVELTDMTTFDDPPFTISSWVKMDQLPSVAGQNFEIFTKANGGIVGTFRFGIVETSDKLRFQKLDDNCTDDKWVGSNFTADLNSIGVWKHVAVTHGTSNDIALYIDGALDTQQTDVSWGNGICDSNDPAYIGGRPAPYGRFFNGIIDDVRIYNRALSAAEVAMLHTCTAPGKIVYNADDHVMQFCSDKGVHPMALLEPTPTGCPNIGDICDDGSVFAGISPDGDKEMYTTPANQSNASYWGTYGFSTGSNSSTTGEENTEDVYVHVQNGDGNNNPDDGDIPNALVLCTELAAHGHYDWYLPARTELQVLYNNRVAIGNLGTADYWSSSEFNNNSAFRKRFISGGEAAYDKSETNAVRCVRTEPVSCTSIGDVCPDGSVYAGISPDGNEKMYTTPADAGLMSWNDGGNGGWTDTGITNCQDTTPGTASTCRTGEANTAQLMTEDSNSVDDATEPDPHIAARYCYCLGKPLTSYCADDPTSGASGHGHRDWYLPALDELDVLYENRAAIGAFNETGILPAGAYWTSSEYSDGRAGGQRFSDGYQDAAMKDETGSVRCVRRGKPISCLNPDGAEGKMIYNIDHSIMQYCNGSEWIGIGK